MGMAQDLTNLGEEMLASFDARVNFLGQNIVDVKKHAADARKFLRKCGRDHAKMAQQLDADLDAFMDNLEQTVGKMQGQFRKEQGARGRDCKAAHQAWQRASKTMATKRRNFNGQLSRSKQQASQPKTH